jgi:hypothetical protein
MSETFKMECGERVRNVDLDTKLIRFLIKSFTERLVQYLGFASSSEYLVGL